MYMRINSNYTDFVVHRHSCCFVQGGDTPNKFFVPPAHPEEGPDGGMDFRILIDKDGLMS